MTKKRLHWSTLCALLLVSTGCDLGPGAGWTRVESDVHVAWEAAGRLDDKGQLTTSKSYLIDFESLEIEIESIAFETVEGAAETGFDPGNPPEGYSLCHNGHCHNANDELIPYETIRLEMGGASASSTWTTQTIEETVQVKTDAEQSETNVPLGECDDLRGQCEIGPHDLRSVQINIRSAALNARVFHSEKLPLEGSVFPISSSGPITLTTYFPVELGADSKATLALSIQLLLKPQIWDAIEWEDFVQVNESPEISVGAILTDALKHNARLRVN